MRIESDILANEKFTRGSVEAYPQPAVPLLRGHAPKRMPPPIVRKLGEAFRSHAKKLYAVMTVPVLPSIPAAAHSSDVMRALPSGNARTYSMHASTFGSMEPGAN